MKTFPEIIKELRTEQGWSQAQLASRVGCTKQTISLWERGIKRPEFQTFDHLADIFHVKASYLLGVTVDKTPPAELSEREVARGALEEDEEILTGIVKRFVRLSTDSRRIVTATLNETFRMDREKGRLLSDDAYTVTIRSTSLDRGDD